MFMQNSIFGLGVKPSPSKVYWTTKFVYYEGDIPCRLLLFSTCLSYTMSGFIRKEFYCTSVESISLPMDDVAARSIPSQVATYDAVILNSTVFLKSQLDKLPLEATLRKWSKPVGHTFNRVHHLYYPFFAQCHRNSYMQLPRTLRAISIITKSQHRNP